MRDWQALIPLVQAGDADAFGQIIRQFQDMAVGYAYSVLHDFDLAEDAAQEAFLQVYLRIGDLREPAAFPVWLRRIVHSQCVRQLRSEPPRAISTDDAPDIASGEDTPDEIAARKQLVQRVLDAVNALPDSQRVAVTLYYINGYTQGEVAEFVNAPLATVKSRLRLARNKLRKEMVSGVDNVLKESKPNRELGLAVMEKISTYTDEETCTVNDGETVDMQVRRNLAGVSHVRIGPHIVEEGTQFDVEWLGRDGKPVIQGLHQAVRMPTIRDGCSDNLAAGGKLPGSGRAVCFKIEFGPVTREGRAVTFRIQASFDRPLTTKEMRALSEIRKETMGGRVGEDLYRLCDLLSAYEAEHGTYPTTLAQLDDSRPRDLYSRQGDDYLYESGPNGFLLSSCGEDGIHGTGDDLCRVTLNYPCSSSGFKRSNFPDFEDLRKAMFRDPRIVTD